MQTLQKNSSSTLARAAGYMGDGTIEKAVQGPFMNEEHSPKWVNLSA